MDLGFFGDEHALGGPKLPPPPWTRVLILAAALIIPTSAFATGGSTGQSSRPGRAPRFRNHGATSLPSERAWVRAADETYPRPDFYDPDPEGDLGPVVTGPGMAIDPPLTWPARPARVIPIELPGARLHRRC